MHFVLAAGLGMALAAAPAAADPAPTFALLSGTFNAPLPDGYCVAGGKFEALAKVLASADTTNLTDVTYVDCDALTTGTLSSWGMIKTPLATLQAKAPARGIVLAQIKASAESASGKKVLDISSDDLARKSNLNKIFGPDLKGSAKFEPMGYDGNAVYFGGVANYDDGKNPPAKIAVAYSITTVNGSYFSIYLYRRFTDAGDITALLDKIKPETAAFIAANGG
jgi:hypothetical protein